MSRPLSGRARATILATGIAVAIAAGTTPSAYAATPPPSPSPAPGGGATPNVSGPTTKGLGFRGTAIAFVDTAGHLRTRTQLTGSEPVVDTGHTLPTASTSSASIASGVDGTLSVAYPDAAAGNQLFVDNSNTQFVPYPMPGTTSKAVVDRNTSPAYAINGTSSSVAWVQDGSLLELANAGPQGGHQVFLGTVLPGTSPATVVPPGGGYLTTWIDPNGHLSWNLNSTSSATFTTFTVATGSSPTVDMVNSQWRIDVVDDHSQLWEVSDASPTHPTQALSTTSVRRPGSVSTSVDSVGEFVLAWVDTGDNLWVRSGSVDTNTGIKVQPGNNPAVIGADVPGSDKAPGGRGWAVVFESAANQHAETLSSGSATPVDTGITMNSAYSPTITGLLNARPTTGPVKNLPTGTVIAYQDADHTLKTVTADLAIHSTGLALDPRSSPDVQTGTNKGFANRVAVTAATGTVWIFDANGAGQPIAGSKAAPGTSPAFDGFDNDVVVRWNDATTGRLATFANGTITLGAAMAPGTSPTQAGCITDPTGHLAGPPNSLCGPTTGVPTPVTAPGASPNALFLSDGDGSIADVIGWEGPNHKVQIRSAFSRRVRGVLEVAGAPIRTGTHPAVTVRGTMNVAYQGADGLLYLSDGTFRFEAPAVTSSGLPMDPASSPDVSNVSTGATTAFQNSNHELWVTNGAGQSGPIAGAQMAPGTSPSINTASS